MDVDSWARSLAEHLQHHMDTEREVLRRYGQLVEDATEPRIAYLIGLILDDEVRHHRLFAEMVTWLRAETESRPIATPRLPSHTGTHSPDDVATLRATTDKLLELEREDLSELEELRRQVTEVEDTAWWTALIDTMKHDTHKHVDLLEYIRKSLRSA